MFKKYHNKLYLGLIITFSILYLFVGFVSTLHSISFFHLTNVTWLAILLGLSYEIGQSSVLFSILMTKNKNKVLPWAMMILLTALQITANVYGSFKFIESSNSNDWMYWQKSILIGVEADSPELYKVIISWISGALLPVVALGMTALVAQNIKLREEEIQNLPEMKSSSVSEPELQDEGNYIEPDRSEQTSLESPETISKSSYDGDIKNDVNVIDVKPIEKDPNQ
jgi:hypothetical protein